MKMSTPALKFWLLLIFLILCKRFSGGLDILPHYNQPKENGNGDSEGRLILKCLDDRETRRRGGWYGRVGNNIVSIVSAALDAQSRGLDLKMWNCSHWIFDLSKYSLTDAEVDATPALSMTPKLAYYLYLFRHKIGSGFTPAELVLPSRSRCIRQKVLSPLFSHIPVRSELSSNNVLVIHLRGGDGVFTYPHSLYAPPPLAYYVDIIERFNGRNIILVTESHNISPIVSELLRLYPKAQLQAGTLEDDVGVLLSAKHLVISHGTFAWSLALASSNLEFLYTFKSHLVLLDKRAFGNINLIEYSVPEYIDNWVASDEQVAYVMNFPRSNLKREVASIHTCD